MHNLNEASLRTSAQTNETSMHRKLIITVRNILEQMQAKIYPGYQSKLNSSNKEYGQESQERLV